MDARWTLDCAQFAQLVSRILRCCGYGSRNPIQYDWIGAPLAEPYRSPPHSTHDTRISKTYIQTANARIAFSSLSKTETFSNIENYLLCIYVRLDCSFDGIEYIWCGPLLCCWVYVYDFRTVRSVRCFHPSRSDRACSVGRSCLSRINWDAIHLYFIIFCF